MDEYWVCFSLNATKGVVDHVWMYIVHEWERNNQEMNDE